MTSDAPGTGARVGVIDTGIYIRHEVFEGVDGSVESETSEREVGYSHGTAVAGIAVGSPNDLGDDGAPGLAWGAHLRGYAVQLGRGDGIYRPTTLDGSSDGFVDTYRFRDALAADLDVLNLSFGVSGTIDGYTEAELRRYLPKTIEAFAQAGKGENPTILVWAAGNAANDFHPDGRAVDASSPELAPGLPVRIPELRGHHVAAVSIGEDGGISSFSNRCGSAADWCIAAPGEGIRVAYATAQQTSWDEFNGTSFAAPHVAGALALMRQVFRGQLSNEELVARMYATAYKSGIYANRAVYGQGLLDVGAATTPVGRTSAVVGARADGPGHDLAATGFDSGTPAGDALARAFAGREVAGFDALGAPFWHDLRPFASAAGKDALPAALRAFLEDAPSGEDPGQPLGPGFVRDPAERRGHLGLAAGARGLAWRGGRGQGIRAFTSEDGGSGVPRTSGALLSWSSPDGGAGARAGWIFERDGLLRSRARGGFGRLASNGLFAGGSASGRFRDWELAADIEIGWSRPAARGGWIEGVSPVLSSAFALRAERAAGARSRIALMLAQPLRVEAGQARFAVPVGRGHDGRVLHDRFAAGLRPSGREIAVGLRLAWAVGETGEVRLGAAWTRDPGHVRGTEDDLALMAGMRTRW